MVAEVTPNPAHYRRLSEHFHACADLSEREREEYLGGPNVGDPSLREELRSLLKHHAGASESPVAAPPVRMSAARALLSFRGRQIFSPVLILGVSTVLLALVVRSWTLGHLEGSVRAEGLRRLQETLRERSSTLRAWLDHKRDLVRTALEDPVLVAHVEALSEAAKSPGAAAEALRASPSAAFASSLLSQAPEKLGEHGFSVFDPSGVVLCSDSEGAVGRPLSPGSTAILRGMALGGWTVSRPIADRQLGLKLDPELPRPVIVAGGPVRGGQGEIVAYAVFLFSPRPELDDLLSLPGTAELLAFDGKSLLLNNLKDRAGLVRSGLLPVPRADQTALRVHLRDPGRELKAGAPIEAADEQWAPTRMCLSATQGRNGSDAAGYRNLLGRRVVGAWEWLPDQEMGLGAEEELDAVLAPLQPLRSAFLFMIAIPAILMAVLLFTSGRLKFPRSRGEESIGFYVVERPIGKGGMGDVFLATHSILSRPAALKILRDSRPNGATIGRFKREARLASRLGHPNSIQIFDYGETSDGRLYYAMEYVEGLNLAQLLTLEGPLSVARSVYLLRQISGALEEAHTLGLLHRDLKPSNIMIGRKGGLGDVVKILDFGIASSVSGVAEDFTRTTEVVGTPAYMAPEQIRRPHQLDFRSDIYSFGGVAFHMLTGRSIFEGPGPAELIYQVLTSKRPSPSKLRGEALPEGLEALVLDCLAIEPELRPSSMSEIAGALKSIEMREQWSQDEARTWWADNREKVARFKSASS